MATKKSGASEKREQLRRLYWPDAVPWTGENDKGWFRAPRTLPLVLSLLRSKGLSGKKDPSRVYLALFARHVDGGIVEITNEAELAYESGYSGSRALRTWQERMDLLERLGFVKFQPTGNQKYRYVLLVHPLWAVERLRKDGKVPENWWSAFVARRLETKESSYEKPKAKPSKVIPMASGSSKAGGARTAKAKQDRAVSPISGLQKKQSGYRSGTGL